MTFALGTKQELSYNVIEPDDARRPMPLHFLKTAMARTLSLTRVMRMSDEEAHTEFRVLRWPDTNGAPVCRHCGCERCYHIRTRNIFKCAACRRTFSVTSGTIFNSRKLPIRDHLVAIALFVNAVKGISALQISRDLKISYKAAFVLLHKLREAIDHARSSLRLGGEVEIDGAYYGGHVRPLNTGRGGKRSTEKRTKKCVLTMVERGGATVATITTSENSDEVLAATGKHLLPDTIVFADEHASYDVLHAHYETHRINHSRTYAEGNVSTNQAESFHSRMRRGEIGQYHRISGRLLHRYAVEMAYRSDRRRVDNGATYGELGEMALRHPVSREWKGYWQARAPNRFCEKPEQRV